MSKVYLFDTTLRDGTQSENISLSADDKLYIARQLDELGIDYVEGGWPGSNPTDMEFFKKVKNEPLKHTKIVAFGSTKRAKFTVKEDPNIQALLEAETPAVSIFGKSWILHVEKALRITPEKNLELIFDSVSFLKSKGREVIYDAEHFFDGYKSNAAYAVETLKTAEKAGADWLVLCDTNGGSLPSEVAGILTEVKKHVSIPLGIHAHNDSGLAGANSITAVQNGCTHVQGTINGYGERCGNANLCEIIPNLQLKAGFDCIGDNIKQLTYISHYVSEVANLSHPNNMPFTGKSAFAHKGGVHVSAVMKDAVTYEHVAPESVGNKRRVLVSDLSGQSNILFKAQELNIDIESHKEKIPEIVQTLKKQEHLGYLYEAAEGSLEILINKVKHELKDFFKLEGFRILIEKNETDEDTRSEATIRVSVGNEVEHTAAEGHGPVNALDNALRKALTKFYPEIGQIKLSDYKVRVLNAKDATAAKVRVLIDSVSNGESWGTVGVSEDIIEASWQALTESMLYYLMKHHKEPVETVFAD